ncbi:PH domain-containing protein [Marvinbryantia sp.]|uniref:PH domain-containing protein n=1 Tax=Marvinbryantia sp. TaxID=2496532 RepID=UPI0025E50366|nr:PH domain-containing protein [uncultured Marvinbryantia sp.]
MKFKGKAAVWFWGIFVVGNALFLWKLIFSSNNLPELIVGMAMFEVVFLPILLRNYIFLGLGSVTVVFGIGKDSIKISDIIEVYQTHNPIASSAASLDRIVIKGRRQEIMCAVQEKQRFFEELKKRNPQIKGI